jgi:hypothetical protein
MRVTDMPCGTTPIKTGPDATLIFTHAINRWHRFYATLRK